jgi:hypothetical protein
MTGIAATGMVGPRSGVQGVLLAILSVEFALAFATKVSAIDELHEILFSSQLVPVALVRWVAIALLTAEAVVSIGLLVPRSRGGAVNLALLLSSVFVSYATWRAVNGIPTPCHCFGHLFTFGPLESLALSALTFVSSGLLYSLIFAKREGANS